MFEKVSRSLKYDSNIFFVHKHIYIYTVSSHLSEHIGTKGCSDQITYIQISITEAKVGGVFVYFCVFARATVGFQVFG